MMRLAAVLSISCLAFLAGCFSDEEQTVDNTFSQWASALANGDGPQTCGYMTAAGQSDLIANARTEGVKAASCDAAVVGLFDQYKQTHGGESPPEWLSIYTITLDGKDASVKMFSTLNNKSPYLYMVEQNGKWLINKLDPTEYP